MKLTIFQLNLCEALFLLGEFLSKNNGVVYITDDREKINFFKEFLPNLTENIYIFSEDTIDLPHDRKRGIFILEKGAILNGIPDIEFVEKNSIKLRKNLTIERLELINFLMEENYIRVPVVEEKGEFAVRGFIMDIFPPDEEFPVRIEFEENRIERIKIFDVFSQRSIKETYSFLLKRVKSAGKRANPFNFLPEEKKIFIDSNISEPAIIESQLNFTDKKFISPVLEELKDYLEGVLNCEALREKVVKSSRESFRELSEEIRRLIMIEGKTVIFACPNSYHLERFYEIFLSYHLPARILKGDLKELINEVPQNKNPEVLITLSNVRHSFIFPPLKIALLSSSHILGIKPRRESKYQPSLPSLRDISPGDYVVHQIHGIGKFEGLVEEIVGGVRKDFLKISYRDNARLLIPVENMRVIHKYISPSGAIPALDSLGSFTWRKKTNRIKKSVEKVAKDLLELYAKRELAKPLKFEFPEQEYEEFVKTFQFEETPSQKKAIEDVISDLTSNHSTDRLICGDAGFGKTEIALRASFLAASNGFQTLVLAPTTLLVEQHYRVFSERFRNFPVIIEKMSRFVPLRERKRIERSLGEGKVDILIATHSVLSEKIKFKNLGLLIIDEEHRFGVAQKEFFRKARENVEVLSLSATPIPRTLYLALSGIKSMSVIDTPPPERKGVKTYIVEFSEDILKEAIKREVERNGQVFFINDRIHGIEYYAHLIKKIFPQLRVEISHGRMRPLKIEKIMLEFIEGKIDVLVSTNIIEAGLDLPNVNTIIVNNAHSFGMADLYQLRGRVGRSWKEGYAYFLLPPGFSLTENAEKRLLAIRRFIQPGSAYKLALEDLEIRGAGTILGKAQSGKIDDVGFDYYMEMLRNAIFNLRGLKGEEKEEVTIKINIPVRIPAWYVPEESLRLKIYRSLSLTEREEELRELEEEMIDRYGPVPEEVNNLFHLIRLKIKAIEWRVTRIEDEKESLRIFFKNREKRNEFLKVCGDNSEVEFDSVKNENEVMVKFKTKERLEWVQKLTEIFEKKNKRRGM